MCIALEAGYVKSRAEIWLLTQSRWAGCPLAPSRALSPLWRCACHLTEASGPAEEPASPDPVSSLAVIPSGNFSSLWWLSQFTPLEMH